MTSRLRRERFIRQVQTGLVILAMAGLFAAAAYVLVGAAGLAVLVGTGFVMLLFLGGREIRVDTSAAKPIKPGSKPALDSILDELTEKAGLPRKPEVYAVPTEEMNAATMGSQTKPLLFITAPMFMHLTDRELRCIIAHEIVHLSQHDLAFFRLVMFLQILTITVARFGWFLLLFFWPFALTTGMQIPFAAIALVLIAPFASILLQAALSRAREYAADLGAVELTGDAEGLAQALEKIDRSQAELWRQVLPVPQRRRNKGSILRTHPAQDRRIAKLRELERAA